MSTKALRKELLAAIAMVIVAAIALSGSTYAWFAQNNVVTATGMTVKTQVSDNLFIAADTVESTTVQPSTAFKTAYINSLEGLLEPVSTVNGTNFFYNALSNAGATGDAKKDEYVTYDHTNTSAFDTNYGTNGAKGYVEYAFQLKAVNGSTGSKNIDITNLNITYGTTASAVTKAFRTAIFVENLGDGTTTPAGGVGNLLSISRAEGSTYFTTDKAVSTNATLAAVSTIDKNLLVGTVAANSTQYYKVVVRLWLEGEDSTCNNDTFAALTDSWAIDVVAKLENTNDSTKYITSRYSTGKVDLTSASVNTTTDQIVVDDITYYVITSKSLDSKQLYTPGTSITSGSAIFTYDLNQLIEVTNQCKLPN